MRENVGKMRTRVTPHKDTFYAVLTMIHRSFLWPHLVDGNAVCDQAFNKSKFYIAAHAKNWSKE